MTEIHNIRHLTADEKKAGLVCEWRKLAQDQQMLDQCDRSADYAVRIVEEEDEEIDAYYCRSHASQTGNAVSFPPSESSE